MAPHLLEEAFEAVEAIQKADAEESCEELGDVLMNVLMIAQIASESGRFNSEDVARTISDKLVRRHPHVFGDVVAQDSDAVLQNWEQIKKSEKGEKPRGALDGVPVSLPALQQALRIGEKAHRTGFDWPDAQGPRAKLDEELGQTVLIVDEVDDLIVNERPNSHYAKADAEFTPELCACYSALKEGAARPRSR